MFGGKGASKAETSEVITETEPEPAPIRGSNVWSAGVGIFAAFGGVLFGYDTGTISGILAMTKFKEDFHKHVDADGLPVITSDEQSLIVSLLSLGTFFGALTIPLVADSIGRKWGLIASCGVFCFGVILQTAASAQPLFIVGRVFAGFGVGLVSGIVPLYQSEATPKKWRGAIVSLYQFTITIGLLLAAVVDNSTKDRTDTGSYRIPIAVQFAWAIILAGGMLILPETPRFFVKKDRVEDAAKSLGRLRSLPADDVDVRNELAEICANHQYELSLGKSTYIDCFRTRGKQLKRIMTGIALQALQQLTGINFIFYYGTTFFANSGITNAFTITIITSVVNVVTTIPGVYLVDKIGRRKLLLYGAIGMTISEFIVAIVGTVVPGSQVANKVLIAFVCTFICSFAASWGPVAWVVTGEIFSLRVRAKSLSITTASNWLLNFVIGFVTPYLVDSDRANLKSKVFFIWGTCNFVCIAFVYFFIYETKGLSLEQIDELYENVSYAPKSASYHPSQHGFTDEMRNDVEKGSMRNIEYVNTEATSNSL